MMIRFVGSNADGLPQKRSQSLRACEHCRKQKKRCLHDLHHRADSTQLASLYVTETLTPAPTRESGPRSDHQIISNSEESNQSGVAFIPPISATDDSVSVDESENGERFVGDLNPESIFLAATSPETTLESDGDKVGIWFPRRALEGSRRRLTNDATSHSPSSDPLMSNLLLLYMQRQCQQMLPQPADFEALHLIYVQEVHPIFPAIDLESYGNLLCQTSPAAVVVKQAICLAASTSPRAAPYLQLPSRNTSNDGLNMSTSGGFANQLSSTIRVSIDIGYVKDRIVIIQVMSILALFSQFSGQPSLSAEIAARVMSHAQTLGLHLEAPSTKRNEGYYTRLFCCVWALDKLNAAFQGRPTMLHSHDFGRDLNKSIALQEGCFRLLLKVILQLDDIIALYRPTSSSTSNVARDAHFASFEELLHECDAIRVSSGLLATIETLYHAVILLSCRSGTATGGGAPLGFRETLSATSIVSIVGTEFYDQISHIPFVPYALSLSLRVFYRELRFSSKSSFSRNRARKQLISACELLRKLCSANFPSANKVADLAEQTVKEMDKIYASILQKQGNSKSNSTLVDTDGTHKPTTISVPTSSQTQQPSASSSMTSFDPSAFDDLPDLDVFEYFNSDFHLDAVDAALIDNMASAFTPTYR